MSKTTYEALIVFLLLICLGCSSAYKVFNMRNYPEFENRPTSNVTSYGAKHEACPQTSYSFPNVPTITDYLRLQTPVPDLDEFTLCAWYTPYGTSHDSWFSYANHDHYDAFSMLMYQSYLYLHLNGHPTKEDMIFSMNKEYHFCFATFAASTANSYMFINGHLEGVYHGPKGVIKGGGLFIMGMFQRSYGGAFHSSHSAQGKMSNFMVWDRVLTFDEIGRMSKNRCFCPPDYLFTAENKNIEMFGAVTALSTQTCPHK